jgi:hypothetical protein
MMFVAIMMMIYIMNDHDDNTVDNVDDGGSICVH